MIELAKINENGTVCVVACSPSHDGEKILKLRNAGYLDFVASEAPTAEPGFVAVDSFVQEDGKLVQHWEIVKDPVPVMARIDELKKMLSATDYQVTKCYEAQLVGEPMPYDIAVLHASRQAIRDEINALEEQLK